ncbi:MAG: hypothetical protein GWN58_58525 [Anaerolineae bacterium]|nr:hypothetical protein [Anaerolineae bacterium]
MSLEDLAKLVKAREKFIKLESTGASVDCMMLGEPEIRKRVWENGIPEEFDPQVHDPKVLKSEVVVKLFVPGEGIRLFSGAASGSKILPDELLRAYSNHDISKTLFTICRKSVGPKTQYSVSKKGEASDELQAEYAEYRSFVDA